MHNKPKQYIQSWVEFYKLKFKVTPDVLIPRPETELLVDAVLNFLQTTNYKLITIIDLGTGTGNIAISIVQNLPSHILSGKVKIIASDISGKALKVAKQNAKLHGVSDKIVFIQSDLLQNMQRSLQNLSTPSIIVTNLPYIPSARIPYLDSSVKDYEPHAALDGGEDGFEPYRKLFGQISKFMLPPRGWKLKLIVCEIDYTHGELAINEAQKYFPDAQIEVKTDLAHKQRILTITR